MKRELTPEENQEFDNTVTEIMVCPKCRLCKSRTLAVPGDGSRTADIMFVGEGPGKNEDLKGLPFVGAAGKFLDKLLESINLKRSDIYITNTVKCRPPENREPKPDEIEACLPYLRTQTRIIKPKVICTLGNAASRTLVSPDISISKTHGKFYRKKGIVFCTLYHPAAALYNQGLKETLEDDFKRLGKFLEEKLQPELEEVQVEEAKDISS